MTRKDAPRWRGRTAIGIGGLLVIGSSLLNPWVMVATAVVLSGIHHFRRGVSPAPSRANLLRTGLVTGLTMWTVLVVGENLIDWLTREPELIIEGQALAGETGARPFSADRFLGPGLLASAGMALFLYGITPSPRARRKRKYKRRPSSGDNAAEVAETGEADAI
jgi:hypothetical protein